MTFEVAKEQQQQQQVSDSNRVNDSAILMEIVSSTLALQALAYVTFSSNEIEEWVNTCVVVEHDLVELEAMPRLVEFIFELSSNSSKCSQSTKKDY